MSNYPLRPALRYYGSKWNMAPWIVSFFPKHEIYVEPYGGGAAVLLQKPIVRVELYNDLDGRVVNFFKVLREQPDELVRLIALTPTARAEMDVAKEQSPDPLEDARRLYVLSWQSINGATDPSQSFWRRTLRTHADLHSKYFITHLENLIRVAWRMANVQIENRDALEIIASFDTSEALLYVDPPYVHTTRATPNRYAHEMEDVHHIAMAEKLMASHARLVVSGYKNDFYAGTLEQAGFVRFERTALGNSGFTGLECVWLNQPCLQAYLSL
jgi:DNA adenine methylase